MNIKIFIGISFVIGIIISGSIIYFINNQEESNDNDSKQDNIKEIDLEILVSYSNKLPSEQKPQVGYFVFFKIAKPIEDLEYIWDLGEGPPQTGEEVTIVYSHSDVFNVSVRCKYYDIWYNASKQVSITNQDVHSTFGYLAKDPQLRKSESRGSGFGHSVDKGVTTPNIEIEINMEQIVGTVTISVWQEDYDGDESKDVELDSIEITKQNEDYTYNNQFSSSLFNGVQKPFMISVYANTVQGYNGGWSGYIDIDY